MAGALVVPLPLGVERVQLDALSRVAAHLGGLEEAVQRKGRGGGGAVADAAGWLVGAERRMGSVQRRVTG